MTGRAMLMLTIAPDHPAFAGHFPGMPVVPGVVLLDEALHAIGSAIGQDLAACRVDSVKFLSPVLPQQELQLGYELGDHGAIRFTILHGARKVAAGMIHRPA